VNRQLKVLLILSCLVVFIGITIFFYRNYSDFNQVSVDPQFSKQSIYGILTSSRWNFGAKFSKSDLVPVKNSNPNPEPQPSRDHPHAMEITPDGKKLYIALLGSELEPGSEVAVFDVTTRKIIKKIRVGSSPYHLALHPKGRFLVVINRFSNYASVIDIKTDEVVFELPLDFYCQYLEFTKDGSRAFISNRYLNQVFVVDFEVTATNFSGKMRELGGFDQKAFITAQGGGILHKTIRRSCGTVECHSRKRGGFYAGEGELKTFFSAIENSIPGDSEESLLLKAVRPVSDSGFADDKAGNNFHAGGKLVLTKTSPVYKEIAGWIDSARVGPGIPVGNFGSKPHSLAISSDEKYLFVGNLGTTDIAVIDLEKMEEVTAIYTQNVITDLEMYYDQESNREFLIALSLGIGFGAAKERDPLGGEVEDRSKPAAQFTVLRDPKTAGPYPLHKQKIMGPFDAIDGTAASKMTDIQNDIVLIDVKKLKIPARNRSNQLQYALKANRYEAHQAWVRYTSDSAEILPQDTTGDIPPELQRVVGAFPEAIEIDQNRAFTAMLGSYELVEWMINANATEPSDYMEPVAVYKTGIMPRDVVVGPANGPAENLLFVSNFLGETVTVIDRSSGSSNQFVVGNLTRPFGDTNAEKGEMFVNTTAFSVDVDTSCMSCHIYGTSDGRGWGAGQAIAQMRDGKFVNGGILGIPQIRNLFSVQPFYFEGTHTAFDAQFDDAREHVALQGFLKPNPHGDFTKMDSHIPVKERHSEYEEIQDKMSSAAWGDSYMDLKERRDEHMRRLTLKFFGKSYNFRDFQRFIGDYQASEPRLMPNPFEQEHPSVIRGRLLFSNLGIGCVTCHPPPEFTTKEEIVYNNKQRVLPPLISFTRREKAFTLISPHWMDTINHYKRDVEGWEEGSYEEVEGHVTSFSLRGMFDRPFAFLHHGRAKSVRETFASPQHYSLRRYKYPVLSGGEVIRPDGKERGFNELSFLEEKTFMMDTHGGTSHLSAREVQDLENFILSIE
jgi:YVTN family beta-propeller protein